VVRKHAKELRKIISRAYKNNNTSTIRFIDFSFRSAENGQNIFLKAVYEQNKIEDNSRVVAISGITPDQMFSFEGILREKFPDIKAVYATNTTNQLTPNGTPLGRYNLLCTRDRFTHLAKALHSELASCFTQFMQEDLGDTNVDLTDLPTVISNFPGKHQQDQGSVSSDNSLSTRDSLLTATAEFFADFPIPEAEPDFGVTIPITIDHSSSSDKVSGLSPQTPLTYAAAVQQGSRLSQGYGPPSTPTFQLPPEITSLITTQQTQLAAQQEQLHQMMILMQQMSAQLANLPQAHQHSHPSGAPSPYRKKSRTASHDGSSSEEESSDNMIHDA
jgi:hypothetical protein